MSSSLLPPRRKKWKEGTPQIGVFLRTAQGGTIEMCADKARPEQVHLVLCLIFGTEKMAPELLADLKKYVDEFKPDTSKRTL